MSKLTPTERHADNRYLWKTLPSMKENMCMIYPLICWHVTKDFYENRFLKFCNTDTLSRLPLPNILEDDTLILIKGGNNRHQAAVEIGFTSIDCIIFTEQNDTIKWTQYLSKVDPYNNLNLSHNILII